MPVPRSLAIAPDQFTTFGDLLKFLRRRAGLTQRELSIALGYSTSQISRLEHDERPPDAANLAARFVPALQLGTEPDWAARLLELAAISRAAVQPPETDDVTPAPTPPHNLPSQLTSFIGREYAIAQGQRLLRSSRLVTLTGAGGSGKTRLALQIAAQVLNDFPDGVWLVELAPLADPALVPPAMASVLGVPEQPSRPILDTLATYLRARTTLLVLDNCEHLISACAQLAEGLLKACPNVRLLATSREALDLSGEMTLAVPPLSFPDEGHPVAVAALRHYDAVRLFVDRAATVLPDFALTSANARAVAQVCRQLDGLPLAIEMAAARVKLLQVEQIAERLTDRFQLLTDGRRTALPRHKTLAAVMDWSYDLLSEPERALLRRLAVFAGGWTLEAAEQVCGDEPSQIGTSAVLDLLTGLVNKSLVVAERQAGQEARYYCLETIRQYALAKLAASDDAAVTRGRHSRYYCALAEIAAPLLYTQIKRQWLDRLAAELGNIRAALAWDQTTDGNIEESLRLTSALHEFWEMCWLRWEGLAWLASGLAHASTVPVQIVAKALVSAGWLALDTSDLEAAHQYFERGLVVSRTIGDTGCIAGNLAGLGKLAFIHLDSSAQAMLSESLDLFRRLGDQHGIAYVLNLLGMQSRAHGDFESAQAQFTESLALFKQLGDPYGIADVTAGLGKVARSQGDYARAAALFDQSAAEALSREKGFKLPAVETVMEQGLLAHLQGDDEKAKALLAESVVVCRQMDYYGIIGYCLAWLGAVAATQRRPDRAALLLSAAAVQFDAGGRRLGVAEQTEYDRALAATRDQLDEAAFAAEWAEGQALTREQAVELGLRT